MPQVEMGQGVYTAIAMILADELDADLSQVTLQHAPPNDKLYGNPTFGLQVTGNSNSIRAFWKPLRNAGASARAMLVQAAATEWKVEPASCTTSKGQVTHTESGRNLSYGELAAAASSETPPKDVPLKDPKDFVDIAKGLATGERFAAIYELPFLAHATMEPLNATVHVKPDSCEIWSGTQIMARVQSEAAKAAGLPVEKVTVNNHLIGGGFGRRLEPDMVVAAVRIAKQVDGPVKVVWTREEDIQHDMYRPVYRDTIAATLSDGKIVGWKYRVTGSAVIARWLPPAFQKGIDIDAIDSAVDMPYDIPNFHVEYVRAEPPAV